ncbi:aminopeptidase N [Erythrobacter sp. EC-HK427]|uniref:aminopeptidase N n=1 Tax=Erythrobacter sp. EC-HK427 TaxID=2038396 RepID=UPI001252A6FD|nr:aminopeptidase N [Erythrobacter sp. EC-HK427]VVT04258.1 Aminopeptidase N [Erythrobacter sp. EC-HK427]
MDIPPSPAAPENNPDMADAAPDPKAPAVIRREDYAPFAWLVPEVQLDFDLGLDATRVVAKLTVVRNAKADPSPTIRLNGDDIVPLGVSVDGEPTLDWSMDGSDLLIPLSAEAHEITIATQIDPSANTQLMGLYASEGMLCTQCEAEGFRRITFFPDRPDVLSVYTVRMRGDFPVLLSNGNLVAQGTCEDGVPWAEWHDPWPKPSYLFALVAGDLVANSDRFTTMSGREVALNIYVRAGDLERTGHAMESLKASMRWDEEVFGREYDLDLFNIVAVSDFNMGAMENKGLNVFNTKYVLADSDTATDADYDGIEGVIAHEYFHNWSGNRVTCRDWFQLSLKEGITVLRDQLFSQDMGSAAVKRIADVRVLRGAQFPEDSGPLAHPIRPDSYQEISNFYTATVYNKGAEVIRMMRTMCGEERFRAGCDLYFERHDGEAATCEDFVRAMEDGAGLDLSQFRLWYSQAGTPKLSLRLEHEGDAATLHVTQEVPPTPGQPVKQPMPIPLQIALFDRNSANHNGEKLLTITESQASFSFSGYPKEPVVSVNRGFSAPVIIERDVAQEELVFLAAHDDDPFARYEALQDLVVGHLKAAVNGTLDEAAHAEGEAAIAKAIGAVLTDDALDDLMRGELLVLPSETYLAETIPVADPGAIHAAREGLKAHLGRVLAADFHALYDRAEKVPFSLSAEARGARKIKSLVLSYAAASDPAKAAELAAQQYAKADNMTDRQGALMVLCGLENDAREAALKDFYARFTGNALVIDKWFALQASSLHPRVLDHVEALAKHPDFTMKNPNRVRSLHMAMAYNPHAFHDASGRGYRMIADLILALDPVNPQTASRFVGQLGRWRRIEPVRSAMMREQLERIAAVASLSRDTREQVDKSLG